MPVPLSSICQTAAYKHEQLYRYCCAFVIAGLDRLLMELSYFSADDIPESERAESPSIPGNAVTILKNAGVICHYDMHRPDIGIFHGREKSTYGPSHGREIYLYQIVSVSIAETFLERHKAVFEPQQMELAI